jgi:hypothetical protein
VPGVVGVPLEIFAVILLGGQLRLAGVFYCVFASLCIWRSRFYCCACFDNLNWRQQQDEYVFKFIILPRTGA